MDEPNQIQFVDAESFQGGTDEKVTFRMIVLEQLRRLGKIASQEFKGGYWVDKAFNIGGSIQIVHTYVPDSREEYSNAIDYLFDILYPHFDKQMHKDLEGFETWSEEETEKLFEQYSTTDEKGVKVFTKKKAYVFIDQERYKTEVIKRIKRKLFRHINCFLQRNNYLESSRFEE